MHLPLSLLALLVAPLLASAQAADPEQVSFDCMTNPDRNHAVYAGDGACKCFTPAEAANTPGYIYNKCPPPTLGGDVGFPHCERGACKFICPKDYDIMPDGCQPIRTAGGLPMKTLTSLQCEKYDDQPALVSLASGGCSCRERADPDVGGTYCHLPPNALASCVSDIRNIDVGICSFTCIGDREPSEDGLSCVAKTPGGDSGVTPGPNDPKPFICAPHQPLAFARPGKRCACYDDEEYAATTDVKCPAPTTGDGTPGCRNLNGNKDSECWVQCEAKFKASADGKSCEPEAKDQVVKPTICADSDDQYLTADPVEGCVCKEGPSPKWCKTPANGRITCYQNADKSIVECRADECKSGFETEGALCVSKAPPPVLQKLSECTPAGAQLWAHPVDGCVCAAKRPSGSSGCYRPGGDGDAVCKSDGYKKNATCEKVCDDGLPMSALGDCSEA